MSKRIIGKGDTCAIGSRINLYFLNNERLGLDHIVIVRAYQQQPVSAL